MPVTLTRECFAPFGTVIETDGHPPLLINDGTAQRYDRLARATLARATDAIGLSIFVARGRRFPMPIQALERHPLGSQAFVPLDGSAYVIVVATDAQGRPTRPQAFMARPDQGISLDIGVWHHPLIALADSARFLVVDAITDACNVETATPDGAPYVLTRPG